MKNIFSLLFFISTVTVIQAQCFEISSIFVNSCGPTEGENEMFTFEVGSSPLKVNDLTVNWPNNSFLGWCQDAGTAASTAALNATILTSCGWLIEPQNDSIPAGANVLVITSTNISIVDNSFEGLADTMYIIYQCAGNTAGHFANSGSGSRDLILSSTGSCTSTDIVTYNRAQLQGGDGATVLYDPTGNATYINNGCNAPVITINPFWSFSNGGTYDGEICNNHGNIDLTTLLSPNATTGGTWSGPRVTGNNYNPNGFLGIDSVTYTVLGPGGCAGGVDSTIIFEVVAPQSTSISISECDSANIDGTWYSSSQVININTPASTFYNCDSITVINLTISTVHIDSNYLEACNEITYQGVTYYADTILRDTVPGGGGTVSNSCPELFISEYVEGQSNNKAIEIYNGTGVTVDLSNYTLERYSNGATTSSASIILTGMLADGDVYVVYNPSSDAGITNVSDLSSGSINHNGDDAYSLNKNGVIVDIFGNIGCDPGTEWTDLGNGTADNVLYRLPNYTTGLTSTINPPCSFPSLNATNWVSVNADDNFTFLGSHTANCSSSSSSTCDSVFITNIVIKPESIGSVISIQECSNSFTIPNTGQIVTTNGIYNDTLVAANSCDSIQPYNITFSPSYTKTVNATICQGDSFQLEGSNQFVSIEDIYTSTIVVTNGCDTIVTTNLTVENPILTTSSNAIICKGDSITLSASGTPNVLWSTTETTSDITVNPTTTTSYTVQGTTAFGCQSPLEQIEVTVEQAIENVNFNVTPNDTINEGQSIQIIVNGDNIESYSWSPNNENINTISDNPTQTTTYLVTLNNPPCPNVFDSITIVVNFIDDITIITPNGFSPNDDGKNDIFRIVNYEEFETYTLKIYNRWGDLLYEESAYGASWDGKYKDEFQNHDTYVYFIDAKPLNGKPNIQISGSITIIR